MTKPNFIHGKEPESEIVINVESINYVHVMGGSVFVNFIGDENSVHLRGELGQAVWRLVRSSSTTIYQTPAAVENKNAETL